MSTWSSLHPTFSYCSNIVLHVSITCATGSSLQQLHDSQCHFRQRFKNYQNILAYQTRLCSQILAYNDPVLVQNHCHSNLDILLSSEIFMKNTDRDTKMLMVKGKLTISLVVHTKKEADTQALNLCYQELVVFSRQSTPSWKSFLHRHVQAPPGKPWSRLRHNVPCPHARLQKL